MVLDMLELFGGKPAALTQHGIINADLADVVQGCADLKIVIVLEFSRAVFSSSQVLVKSQWAFIGRDFPMIAACFSGLLPARTT